MKVTCLLGGKFLNEKFVKNQGLVGILQHLFQHNRFLVLDTPKLPRDRIKHSSGSYWKLGLRYTLP